MKNNLILILLLVFISSNVFAEFRLTGYMESDIKENNVNSSVLDYLDGENPIYGMGWEVVLNSIGFGGHYGVFFNKLSDNEYFEEWNMDWKSDLFLSYHLFGEKTLLDPFGEIGVGNAGRVNIKAYIQEEDYEYNNDDSNVSNMSLYSYFGLGLAVNLNHLIIGSKVNYKISSIDVPATNFQSYPMEDFTFTFFTGVSF